MSSYVDLAAAIVDSLEQNEWIPTYVLWKQLTISRQTELVSRDRLVHSKWTIILG